MRHLLNIIALCSKPISSDKYVLYLQLDEKRSTCVAKTKTLVSQPCGWLEKTVPSRVLASQPSRAKQRLPNTNYIYITIKLSECFNGMHT